MKVNRLFSFTNNRQIWRLIPAGDNLLIEERDPHSREVYFNCINLDSGRTIFRNFQFDEKFWVGVEVVYNNIIYFHKFGKPDMPAHKEIIAVDAGTLEIRWHNPDVTFLTALEGKVYSFINLFEGREYYVHEYMTGEILETLRDNEVNINELRGKAFDSSFYHDTHFPEQCSGTDPVVNIVLQAGKTVQGGVECIMFEGYLLISYHIEEAPGKLRNIFSIVEIDSEKVIFKEVLNHRTDKIIPDSFFMKGNKIIVIKEKSDLQVYSLK